MKQFNKAPAPDKQENPEVKKSFEDFGRFVSHFILSSRLKRKYNVEELDKTKQSLRKLVAICKNGKMIPILKDVKDMINKIDVNLPFDGSLLDSLSSLLDELTNESKH